MLHRTALSLLLVAPLLAQGSAHYVTMRDDTRIAVDVHLPVGHLDGQKVPTLLELTRYWRSSEDPATGVPNPRLSRLDQLFLANGYALMKVDVRGSGASFGWRASEYGTAEVADGWDLVQWVVDQPWSDGGVGAYGTSYSGTTAELLAASQHPAIKAVIPGWSDFDVFESPARPYGLYPRTLIDQWGELVGMMDDNDPRLGGSVRGVDGDEGRRLLAAAVAEHARNVDVGPAVAGLTYRDDELTEGGPTLAMSSSRHWRAAIEASGVPMLVFASWLDAGTADGALERFTTYSNPQHLVILASSHGGQHHASPFVVERRTALPVPTAVEQEALRLAFFDHHLKEPGEAVPAWPKVLYHNLGEEALLESAVWPPAGSATQRLYFGAGGALVEEAPSVEGADVYAVDFEVTTGRANRWKTQLGRAVTRLHDRAEMDARMRTWTTAPLEEDLQLTGAVRVHLELTTDREDGAVLLYLEDVAPGGQSRYLTEGGRRLIHRGLRPTFARADALPPTPGERFALDVELWSTSALVRRGHRLRLALAGADADTFARLPEDGEVTLEIARSPEAASWIDLPVIAR